MSKTRAWTQTQTRLLVVLAGLPGALMAGVEVDFEDLPVTVPPLVEYGGPGGGAYYNGSDAAGSFTTRGVTFINDYNADWMSWSGWAYSTTTDTETAGFGNQFSAFPGMAASGSVYGVTFAPSSIELPAGYRAPVSIKVANTTYAAISMRDGDMFAKKFGDDPATTDVVETDFPDWFKLTLTGKSAVGETVGTVEFMLADFRGDAETDFILDEWAEIDLTSLSGTDAGIATMEFSLESSDVGDFGMNTPAFIVIDSLVLEETETWGPYDLSSGPYINTGDWLGWVYVEEPWVYVFALEQFVYLPGDSIEADMGAWVFIPTAP